MDLARVVPLGGYGGRGQQGWGSRVRVLRGLRRGGGILVKERFELSFISGICEVLLALSGAYVTIGDPGRALASLQPLDELSSIRHSMRDGLRRCGWPGRAVRDRAFTQLGPDAFVGKTPAEIPALNRDRGGLGVLGGRTGRALMSPVLFAENGHLESRAQADPQSQKQS
jgi:hypothetical protein